MEFGFLIIIICNFADLEMTIDKAITKIFEGWDPLRINLITRTLKKENIHRIEDLHSLDSNAWEVLRGLTDGEVNKIKEFIRKGLNII